MTQTVSPKPQETVNKPLTEVKKQRKPTKPQLQAQKWRRDMTAQLNFRKSNKPIHGEDLGKRWGKSKNYLTKVISDLVLLDGQLIGSSNNGYFYIHSKEDFEIVSKFFKQRGFKFLLRCAVLTGVHVEDVFEEAWRECWETRKTKAVEKNLAHKGW